MNARYPGISLSHKIGAGWRNRRRKKKTVITVLDGYSFGQLKILRLIARCSRVVRSSNCASVSAAEMFTLSPTSGGQRLRFLRLRQP
jgi:hypothetical protein